MVHNCVYHSRTEPHCGNAGPSPKIDMLMLLAAKKLKTCVLGVGIFY